MRRAVMAIVAVAVGSYYLWGVRAAGNTFAWGYDLGGYYDYLGRGFAHGHLYVPIEPSPKLLALPNPWDPAVDDSLKMQDMALYNGHYYLYHGGAPALILFAPWRLATGHDLPESFALFLFCFGGFLFSCGALVRVLDLAKARPDPLLLAAMLLALGVCQCVPYLLNRVWVYEIAIGAGYFCISGAVFFLTGRSAWSLAAAGLMFGLAIGCRPHLGVAGLLACFALPRRRESIAFLIPFALMGALAAEYNYLRFGNPFEFGIRYLLAGANQNRINLAAANVLPGLYFMLFCAPDFSAVFPWVRQVFRYPFNSVNYAFPPGYFIEATVGALYCAPFAVGALLVPSSRPVRALLWAMTASSAAILLFLAATGFTTHRYEVDFLPLAVWVALASLGIHISRASGAKRAALSAALFGLIACGMVVNLALGIAGPYDEMLKNRPLRYVRIARWFSPVEKFRPALNPNLSVDFTTKFTPQPEGVREALVTLGHLAYRHSVYAEHLPGKLRIVSQSDASTISHEIADPGSKPVAIRVAYSPESGRLTTWFDGEEILVHQIGPLVTAPVEITKLR